MLKKVATSDEETKLSKHAIDLNNGRAVMLCILGLMVHAEIEPLDYDLDLPGGAIAHILINGVADFEVLRPAGP